MNKVKLSKAVEISGKSRIFFNYNHLTKNESGDICVEFDDLKRVINDEVSAAKEHLRRLKMYQSMKMIKLSKAVEISGKSRIFFNYNHLTKEDFGDICVECDDLKRVINDEVLTANEHLRRLEMYEKQTANK